MGLGGGRGMQKKLASKGGGLAVKILSVGGSSLKKLGTLKYCNEGGACKKLASRNRGRPKKYSL